MQTSSRVLTVRLKPFTRSSQRAWHATTIGAVLPVSLGEAGQAVPGHFRIQRATPVWNTRSTTIKIVAALRLKTAM